ncbi:heterokaryon incompatibility protein-domain-containing protein [Xylariaceae sp. FL0594]|nr:heterokaryon incompatibility protein-domain-containing protein [Xylariaceae sp. FL0594]
MRLVNTTSFELDECLGDTTKEYAILSHTWDDDECTLPDMSGPRGRQRKGFKKIEFCCEQARRDGIEWAWVDTCCVDSSSTEDVTMTVNSLFRWYQNAKICYVYLADVSSVKDIASCRWLTRAWTLQELIAPKSLRFYSSDWTKAVLITGDFSHVSVANRIAWAANRVATRVEDRAYSLLGLFDVNLSLIYGERELAFLRLQQEIYKFHYDESLFAWGSLETFPAIDSFPMYRTPKLRGLLASSPQDFAMVHKMLPVELSATGEMNGPVLIEARSLQIEYPVCKKGELEFLLLACTIRSQPTAYIGVLIQRWAHRDGFYARCGPLVAVSPDEWRKAKTKSMVIRQPAEDEVAPTPPLTVRILRVPDGQRTSEDDPFLLDEVYCPPPAELDSHEHSITLPPKSQGPFAALFFTASASLRYTMMTADGRLPVSRFALVLGHSGKPDSRLVRHCMTKGQLKDMLQREDMRQFWPEENSLEEVLGVWAAHGAKKMWKVWKRQVHRFLDLSVDLAIGRANLLGDGISVSIKLSVSDVPSRSRAAVFRRFQVTDVAGKGARAVHAERATVRPDWLVVDQWEWFRESKQMLVTVSSD